MLFFPSRGDQAHLGVQGVHGDDDGGDERPGLDGLGGGGGLGGDLFLSLSLSFALFLSLSFSFFLFLSLSFILSTSSSRLCRGGGPEPRLLAQSPRSAASFVFKER